MGRSRNLEGVPRVSTKTDDKKGGDDDGKGAANDDGGGGDDRGTGGAVTLEQVQSVARDVATQVVERLLADDPDDDDDDDGKGGAGGGDGGAPATNAAVERSVAAEVRAELGRIRESEALGERVAKVEAAVVEKPPVKLGRFTRAIWGGDE